MKTMASYFILSCARSGSTSLSKILNTASNSVCEIEPTPNLNVESRLMMDGKLDDPEKYVDLIVKRVNNKQSDTIIFGEKNVTLGPFISLLYEKLNCKFVFLKRDGRDVVRSLINWHEQKFGTIYREAIETGNVSNDAINTASNLLAIDDSSDFSRPRPLPNSEIYPQWNEFSRFQMCSFYWSFINELYLNELKKIPQENWIDIDYSSVSVDDILKIGDFLDLDGLEANVVQDLLNSKINSLEQRSSSSGTFPKWVEWNGSQRDDFDALCKNTMKKLGYGIDNQNYWKPDNFGSYWKNETGGDEDWFKWMYDGRKTVHEAMISWLYQQTGINTIADFGCGIGEGYHESFKNMKYIGVDICEENIDWCLKNRENKKHNYLCQDFINQPLSEKVDLVFSSGTMDNCYDIKEFMSSMVNSSSKWLYLTLYRGWFPGLKSTRYSYNYEHGCFYNNISPVEIREYLSDLGCSKILIEPVKTGNEEIPFETRVIAHV